MLMDAADATGTPLVDLETLNEIEAAFEAAGIEKLEVPEPDSDPSMLDEEREQRFTDELVPIRETLYEEDTEAGREQLPDDPVRAQAVLGEDEVALALVRGRRHVAHGPPPSTRSR